MNTFNSYAELFISDLYQMSKQMKSSKPALVKNTTPNNYIQHDLNKIMYLIKLSDNLLAAKIYFYIIYKQYKQYRV